MADKKLILIVDDNEDVRTLVKIWLTNEEREVITSVSGTDCVKKLTKDVDLILLDIMMPGLTPPEILKAIKRKSPDALVAYLTAVEPFNVTPEQAEKGWIPRINEQVKGYIKKPVEQAELLNHVFELLKKQERFSKSRKKK